MTSAPRRLKNSSPCKHCGELKVPGGALVAHERACGTGGKTSTRRRRTRYREVFFAYNGPGPYECYFNCGSVVEFHEIVVHHIDEDFTNDIHTNLSGAHRTCHNGHHFTELWATRREELMSSPTRGNYGPKSEEQKKMLSEGHKRKGYRPTAEAIEKARIVNTGKTRSEETRRKISEGRKAAKERRNAQKGVMPNGD
jgi:hypothetical protein